MTRDPRRRRAQLLAGIIVGVIVGTAHALVSHVASRPPDRSVIVVQWPAWESASDDGRGQ